jgi:hypothetical protein
LRLSFLFRSLLLSLLINLNYPALWTLRNIDSLPNPDPTDIAALDEQPLAVDKIEIDQEAEQKRPEQKSQSPEGRVSGPRSFTVLVRDTGNTDRFLVVRDERGGGVGSKVSGL